MSETTYTSKIVSISKADNTVYGVLGNPEKLQPLVAMVPENEYITGVTMDADSIRLQTKQFGEVVMRVVDREENKTIKFAAENSPMPVNLWIQLKATQPDTTAMRLTLRADMPLMVKMMVGGKLEDGLNKMASVLTQLPYESLL